LIPDKSIKTVSQVVPAVRAFAVVTATLPSLEALAIVFEALALQTLAASFFPEISSTDTRILRFGAIIAIGAGALGPADLPMGETLTISCLAFRLGAFAFQDTAPQGTGTDFQQIVKPFVF
jgi:hypothetical protein